VNTGKCYRQVCLHEISVVEKPINLTATMRSCNQ